MLTQDSAAPLREKDFPNSQIVSLDLVAADVWRLHLKPDLY